MNNITHISEALNYIPADERDIWLNMGMAIKSALGEGGFDVWNQWSQSSTSYDSADTKRVWKSINGDGGITIGTLFHTAKKYGYSMLDKPIDQWEPKKVDEEKLSDPDPITITARKIWDDSRPVSLEHPYLIAKNISLGSEIKQITSTEIEKILGYSLKSKGGKLSGNLLVLPIKEGNEIVTLQFIDDTGLKAFLPGRGSLKKGVWTTQSLPVSDQFDGVILIGEGMATVDSASNASGHIGIAALSSSRLPTISEQCRKDYPNAKIIILADLKQNTNLPIEAAVKAATRISGFLAIPVFSKDNDLTDFNEMLGIEGCKAVKNAIDNAKKIDIRQSDESVTRVETICALDIKPENISWLWKGWLASGKVHILGGAPGTGKTTICMDLAAIISRGGCWPDGTKSIQGNVVIWSGEDGLSDTLIPRLAKANALRSNIYFVTGITGRNVKRAFDPAFDMELLQKRIVEIGNVKLLVVDPIVSAISGDSHKNAEVRRSLQPLSDLATNFGIALIGITHFSKGTIGRDPVERITGSLAFGALARIVLITAKSQHKNENGNAVRIFMRAKSNIGSDEDGFEYELQQGMLEDNSNISTSYVTWGEKIEGTAKELLTDIELAQGGSKLEDTKKFLINLLKDKPLPQADVKNESKIANISWATVRRAKQALEIKSYKNGSGHWLWQLNLNEDAHNN